jgi:hypothetical protein
VTVPYPLQDSGILSRYGIVRNTFVGRLG